MWVTIAIDTFTDLPLTNGCHNDNMIQLDPLRSQSRFQFIQITYAYFVHLLLQYSSHQ